MGSPYGLQGGCLSWAVTDLGSSCRGPTVPPPVGWSASSLNYRELEKVAKEKQNSKPSRGTNNAQKYA